MRIRPKNNPDDAPDLMFCCSGAADTAEIADRAVRALHKEGTAKMFCLAGIAGDVETIVVNSKTGATKTVVDGCDSDCARKTMERNGFDSFVHFRVTDLGWEKGKTPATADRVAAAANQLRALLREAAPQARV